ncbi:MAG: hypothetical protein ABIP35_01760, partial [Ginsengibacter sp.]
MKIKILYKFLLLLTLVTGISIQGICQENDSLKNVNDTFVRNKIKPVVVNKDSIKRRQSKDSNTITRSNTVPLADTVSTGNNLSSKDSLTDSVLSQAPRFLTHDTITNNQNTGNLLKRLLAKNKFINASSAP